MFRFTIREVLWLMVVAGLGLAFVTSRYELNVVTQRASLCQFRLNWLTNQLKDKGYRIGRRDRHAGDLRHHPTAARCVRIGIGDPPICEL